MHYVFKRWEPSDIKIISLLLFGSPALLSLLMLDYASCWLYAVGASYILHLASLAASIIFYRLSPFHPLARYPGPRIARVSKLWHAMMVYEGHQHLYLEKLHKKYGDVVRIGELNQCTVRTASA